MFPLSSIILSKCEKTRMPKHYPMFLDKIPKAWVFPTYFRLQTFDFSIKLIFNHGFELDKGFKGI